MFKSSKWKREKGSLFLYIIEILVFSYFLIEG